MTSLEIGVVLPSVGTQRDQRLDLAAAARHAESAGLDGVWHGDHLAAGAGTLDCAVALAVAAAATGRIRIGAGVFVPAIRPLAWAAKQIGTLQYVSGGRLVLGVGSGGGAAQWAAAGVPYAERGRRTDIALELLPRLLAGDPVRLPHGPVPGAAGRSAPQDSGPPSASAHDGGPPIAPAAGEAPVAGLAPPVPRPPFWVGNASPVALRRAARLRDGWFPSLVPAAEVAAGARRLAELSAAAGRPVPVIAVGVTGVLGSGAGLPTRDRIAAGIAGSYGASQERAITIPIAGEPAEVAERLAAYRDAGAGHIVMGLAGGDWREQCELLAQARALLP
ncbi:LLM class flavin-dependent oxidoreductase [Sphaerisporangium rufum]|uniref:LLM class flavin-dependent oxidoreductase n=1 Tax=Sphaerisporangium rufum TaxID=1381558 RepID=UPI001951D818|nr:LLM class flavin-dependent oxidoreductase [Sphaerisporangium rufum]